MPTIGRSRGSLPLTVELKALLQNGARRLAPGGVLVARVIGDLDRLEMFRFQRFVTNRVEDIL